MLDESDENNLVSEVYNTMTRRILQVDKKDPALDLQVDPQHSKRLRAIDIVPMNGVVGTVLLVDANIYRNGLLLPPFPFKHSIETEGIGIGGQIHWHHLLRPPQLHHLASINTVQHYQHTFKMRSC